ncbi:addiction module antidote protein, HigA family, partial [Escherichia coli]
HRNSVSAFFKEKDGIPNGFGCRGSKVLLSRFHLSIDLPVAVDLGEVENNMRTQVEVGGIETVAEYLALREEGAKKVA